MLSWRERASCSNPLDIVSPEQIESPLDPSQQRGRSSLAGTRNTGIGQEASLLNAMQNARRSSLQISRNGRCKRKPRPCGCIDSACHLTISARSSAFPQDLLRAPFGGRYYASAEGSAHDRTRIPARPRRLPRVRTEAPPDPHGRHDHDRGRFRDALAESRARGDGR